MVPVSCSCGWKVEAETVGEGYGLGQIHFLENIDTHAKAIVSSGIHAHVPNQKQSWIKRLFKLWSK